MTMRWSVLLTAALWSMGPSTALGQDAGLSSVSGTVFDSMSAAPLPGAEVTLSGGAFTAVTDAEGRFQLRLPPGSYPVDFSHPSLSAWGVLRHGLVLRVEAGRSLSVSLTTAS